MLTKKDKFNLMVSYTCPILIVAGLSSLVSLVFLTMTSIESLATLFMVFTFLKILAESLTVLLFNSLKSKGQDYFYINLGLHPKNLLIWEISIEAILYILLFIPLIIIRNV